MRYFNTLGPVNESEHYVVSRQALITDLVAQIEQGTYFTIYAPRQTGKTTLVRNLMKVLLEKSNYLPIMLSFEAFESWSISDFLHGFSLDLSRKILNWLKANSHPNHTDDFQKFLENNRPTSFLTLREWFTHLHQRLPDQQLILIIDEFDVTPQAARSNLLQIWRQIYLDNEPPRPLHSVALIGLQNIATLNLGRNSPFNIAGQIQLPSFTLAQVQTLLNQYTTETGQTFAQDVTTEIHVQTGGQPFLVNRLAAILTEEIATDNTRPIDFANLHRAKAQLMRERNYNYETLIRHAKSFSEPVQRILFGVALKFTLNTPWINTLNMSGIVIENSAGFCEIANPIYKQILSNYFLK